MILTEVEIVAKEVVVPYYLYLRADGIMYVRISPEKEESVELAQKMVKRMGEIVNYKQVPILFKHQEFALPGKANRDYWATKEACPYSKAEAFIINSIAMRIIANFYLKINKPQRPTKMFTHEEEAIKWLKTFL
jgi:glutaredoxin